jgi:hypothetical protein
MVTEKKIKCGNPECKYEWVTKTKLSMVTCPSCQRKTKVPKDKGE